MQLLKYVGEGTTPHDQIFDHGGQLQWPGTSAGYPVRGDTIPNLKQEEFEQLPHVLDFHCKTFYLWVEKDQKEYQQLRDRIANEWFVEHHRKDQWIELPTKVANPDGTETTMQIPQLMVYLEWVQIYGEAPKGKHPGLQLEQQLRQPQQPQAHQLRGLLT